MAAPRVGTRSSNNNPGASTSTREILCRYFMSGRCRAGENCSFSHDRSHQPSMICKFYQHGSCAYGSSCMYDHVRVKPNAANDGSSSGGASSAQPRQHSAGGGNSSKRHSQKNKEDSRKSRGAPKPIRLADFNPSTSLRPDAPEFVPYNSAPSNYAQAVAQNLPAIDSEPIPATDVSDELCPYHLIGQCWYADACVMTHGLECEMCGRPAVHPRDEVQARAHRRECLAQHERDMEEAFAAALSREKVCGICMEKVLEKAGSNKRFGILPGCKHCFCLDCIRKWRASRMFENKIVRACPECRTVSDYVTPSAVWVEDEDQKKELIESYKTAMSEKSCKYFRKGDALCPFGNQCFYKHDTPDGKIVRGDSPRTVRRKMQPRRVFRPDFDPTTELAGEVLQEYLLWQFLDERNDDVAAASSLLLELALDDDLEFLRSLDSDSDDDLW